MKRKLESSILNLLDTSSAIQEKIRCICSQTPNATIELKNQLAECQDKYQQAVLDIQKYKDSYLQLQSKCNNLENQYSLVENDLRKTKLELVSSEKRIKEYEIANAQLKEQEQSLSDMLMKVNDNMQSLKEQFSDSITLLERYKSLSSSIRTGLSDVICDKNEIFFIVSCSTPEHLKAIWTYTKRLAGSNDNVNGVEVLKDIFDYFFEVFNCSLQEPMYVRDNVEEGYSFDDDKYDRGKGSLTSGKITQVILRGYKSINTGTIICRSVVRV